MYMSECGAYIQNILPITGVRPGHAELPSYATEAERTKAQFVVLQSNDGVGS
jgi:hypothetical protein